MVVGLGCCRGGRWVVAGRAGAGVGYWAEVSVSWVREQLRDAFSCWGLPGLARVGSGYPWVSGGDLPNRRPSQS